MRSKKERDMAVKKLLNSFLKKLDSIRDKSELPTIQNTEDIMSQDFPVIPPPVVFGRLKPIPFNKDN